LHSTLKAARGITKEASQKLVANCLKLNDEEKKIHVALQDEGREENREEGTTSDT